MTTTEWFTRDGSLYTGKVFDVKSTTASYTYLKRCSRCSGQGESSAWTWTGRTCWGCGGHGHLGTKTGKVYTAEKLAQLNEIKAQKDKDASIAREAEAAKFREDRRKKQEALSAAHPGLIESMRSYNDTFLSSLLEQFDLKGELTEKQILAAKEKVERLSAPITGAFVGTVGERREFTLTVTYCRISEGRFGASTFIAFVDSDGNRFTWKASGAYDYERGQVVQGVATVKEHYKHDEKPQTALTRAKFKVISTEGAKDQEVEHA